MVWDGQASVDDSKERFTHGRPDAELLRNFCKEKFNWGPDKVDEILEPVLKVRIPPCCAQVTLQAPRHTGPSVELNLHSKL